MSERVIIIGASGHGKVVADIVTAAGDTVVGFLDDDESKQTCGGYPVLGAVAEAKKYPDCRFIIAIGNNEVRKRIARELELPWYTAVHPSAVISPRATIGAGTVVMPRVVINAEAGIGAHCILNTGAIVEHENHIADYVHLSPGAALGGNVRVGEGAHIGIGASVKNNISICGCTIGAGAAVVKDITESGTYAGVPARRLK